MRTSRAAKLENAKLAKEGNDLHVTTGPAVAYWNPANKASGNYTVKATFTEAKYMSLNDHPHPYGIFDRRERHGHRQQTYLYCAAYGNGKFIVRGFGPAPFQLNGRAASERGDPQGGGPGSAGDAGDRGVGEGRQGRVRGQRHGGRQLQEGGRCRRREAQVDGRRYGIRFGHNTEATVSGLR